MKILILAMALLLLLAACAAPAPAETPHEQAATAEIPTTQQPVTTEALPHPREFDWRNPEGWQANWAYYDAWMEEQGLAIESSDLALGEFYTGMHFEDAQLHFPGEPIIEHREFWKTLSFDTLELSFFWRDYPDDVRMASIRCTTPERVTPRGLQMGDSAERVFELYGPPAGVYNNRWFFTWQGFELVEITVQGGTVVEIFLQTITC